MIPVHQTQFTPPLGNCFAAAIASVLEVPLQRIPSPRAEWIEDGRWSPDYWQELASVLRDLGLYLLDFDPVAGKGTRWSSSSIAEPERHEYWIANGPGPRGPRHSVVMLGPDLAHDPHPEGGGLVTIDGATYLVPYDPAELIRSGKGGAHAD